MTLTLVITAAALSGCAQAGAGEKSSQAVETAAAQSGVQELEGGTLRLKVNPEIAVSYDAEGKVTEVAARNDDGAEILEGCSDLKGKDCRTAVAELVKRIGDAGYFVEDADGKGRQITLEIEPGSQLPTEEFLDEVIADIKECIGQNQWHSPIEITGESDYGLTDYADTDYGPENDGVTDYDDTDYGPENDGVTDYNDTDYGPENDGVTDYNDTDYGPENDGVTDYNDTDYGPENDGVTDYNDTDYGPQNDGTTDYDAADGGNSSYGDSGYGH